MGEWRTRAPMPTARRGTTAGVIDSQVYVAGGYIDVSPNANEIYNPATDTWAQSNALPSGNPYATAWGVINRRLYMAGGWSLTSTHREYNPDTSTWASKRALPFGTDLTLGGVYNERLHVVSGRKAGGAHREHVAYDPVTNSWSSKAGIPVGRFMPAGGVVGDHLYVIGGRVLVSSPTPVERNDAYNFITNTWSVCEPPAADSGQIGAVIDEKLYLMGSSSTLHSRDNKIYTPVMDTWSAGTEMPTGRSMGAAATVDGRVYVFGGYPNADPPTGANEEYTPTVPPDSDELSGTSITETTGSGHLTARVGISGVSETVTDGSGPMGMRDSLSGTSITETTGSGRLVMPVDISGTSTTASLGTGDMMAPYPRPLDGDWITETAGEGSIVLLTNLRGPSLTRTAGRGTLTIEDTTGEFAEAANLAHRLPDTYNKDRGSRITRLFRVVGEQFAGIRRALRTTERMRDIDQATGATLDGIGGNVRQPRGQLHDRAYRALIKAKIARHLSPGDVDSIKEVVAAMLGITPADVGVRQLWRTDPPEPAAVEITAPIHALAQFELSPTQFAAIMQHIVAAGVRVTSLLGGTFELSEDFETGDEERGLADDDMTFGGTLGEYYDTGDHAELPLGD